MKDKNLEDIYIYGATINKAAEYSGITEEQAMNFISKFDEVIQELKRKQNNGTLKI